MPRRTRRRRSSPSTATRPKPVHVGSWSARAVRSRADGQWYWRVLRGGTPQGCIWATPEGLAEELARRVLGREESTETEDVPQTVGDLLAAWLKAQEARTDIMESSKKARRGTTRRLTRVLGGVSVEDLGARHLEAFRDQGGAALTLRAALKDLRSAWRWSRSRGWINRELATIALPEARPTSERHTPTLAEAEQIGAQLQGSRRAAVSPC